MKKVRLVVLSGPSGAGKSTAVRVLEDLGFFCVDNLPVTLLPSMLELAVSSGEITRVAAVIDVREGSFLKDFPKTFKAIKDAGYSSELVYFEASDAALVKRFSETRRRHPLARTESPLEGIALEREELGEVKAFSDKVIDTSDYNVHELKEFLRESFTVPEREDKMTVNIVSFGYRHGIPADCDMLFDVRFLPNPFFVEGLRALDGRSEEIKSFVLEREETGEFLERVEGFLSYLIPLFWKEGKSYLTIGIGCTGGKHRSVAIAEYLIGSLHSDSGTLRIRHRDIEKR